MSTRFCSFDGVLCRNSPLTLHVLWVSSVGVLGAWQGTELFLLFKIAAFRSWGNDYTKTIVCHLPAEILIGNMFPGV